jgi:8-oxo-dGTP pyrophosphatase MutT (NUDIX family)
MTLPVSIKGVLILDGRVVLVKNARDEWELPGGRPDAGEEHAQTLRREFLEELSVSVAVGRQVDSYVFEVVPGREVRIVTYECALDGAFAPSISDEHSEYCLWSAERLSEIDLPAGYRASVQRVLDGA